MKRQPANLSEALSQRLNSYALAASAAGVGVLALAQPVEAKIVYTRSHRVLGNNSKITIDLNHDHSIDFTITQRFGGLQPPSGYGVLVVKPARGKAGNQIWGTVSYSKGESHRKVEVASALSSGESIGPNSPKFRFDQYVMWWFDDAGGTCSCGTTIGQWKNAQNKYLGLKFLGKSGKVHYGWARLSVDNWRTATLTGYAYETIPNQPIIAGKTKGPDVITLREGSLGALAAGRAARPRPVSLRAGSLAPPEKTRGFGMTLLQGAPPAEKNPRPLAENARRTRHPQY